MYQHLSRFFPQTINLRHYCHFFDEDALLNDVQWHKLQQVSVDAVTDELLWLGLEFSPIHPLPLHRMYNMARSFTQTEFVNIRLPKSGKNAFSKWADEHDDDVHTLLANIATDGYKLSCSYDDSRDTYVVAITGQKSQKYNANKCYTSRSSDCLEAILLALYKHYVLADQGNWDKIVTEDDNWG